MASTVPPESANLEHSRSSIHHDVEKGTTLSPTVPSDLQAQNESSPNQASLLRQRLQSIEKSLLRYNVEQRGIQRVLPAQRHDLQRLGFLQMFLLWFSINLSAVNITLGMLGPAAYSLPFLDCSLLAIFGVLVGCIPVGYFATFGPRSGNRTMVLARYAMGWYPAKLVVILTLIVFLGYSLVDVVIAGQILSAASSHGSLSIIVGIVIVSVITWAVTVFGYNIFHLYERYCWFPQFGVIMVLAGVAGPRFDLYTNPGASLTPLTQLGNRVSFFSLSLAAAITYAPAAADFFVYYPEETPRWKVFFVTVLGLSFSFTPVIILGAGLGSGIANNVSWSNAYQVSQGALLVEAFRPLGHFGLFCAVVIALGLISNTVAPTYAASIDWQVLGRHFLRIPRVVWATVSVGIYMVCAIAGRAHLAETFTNFLALMGYFVSIFFAIFIEEHVIFRKLQRHGWSWEAWNDREKLPVGIAALIAFLVGWAGAILCMAQVWYIGPIARLLGNYGGDLGNYVGFAWASMVYPPLRWLEVKRFGR